MGFGSFPAYDKLPYEKRIPGKESCQKNGIFIGPESDHWQCLSVTHSLTDSLTDSCLVNLIDVTLACEDAHSKLVEVATVADDSDEVWSILGSLSLVEILKMIPVRDSEDVF